MRKREIISLLAVLAAVSADVFAATKKPTAKKAPPRASAVAVPASAPVASVAAAPAAEKPLVMSCKDHFELCMDNICVNEGKGREDCSDALDSFEIVEKNGNKVRLGRDLYDYAKGSCLGAFTKCPLAERNSVENNYKILIQTDIIAKNYKDAMAAVGTPTQESLTEFVQCMAPICGTGFADCWNIDSVERRVSKCGDVLAKSATPAAVKREFYEHIQGLIAESCKAGGGSQNYDTKKCSIKVDFGLAEKAKNGKQTFYTGKMSKHLKTQTFNVGEVVECTQEYFSLTYKDRPAKVQGVIKSIFGGIKAIGGAICVVAGAVASVFTAGAGTPLIGMGISFMGDGTADIIEGAIMIESGQRDGACFINNRMVASMGDYFKVNLPVK